MTLSLRAGFSLSRTLFRKMCGPLTWGGRDPIFSVKKWRLFSHHRQSAVSSAASPLFMFSWKKLATSFWSSLSLLFISLVHSSVPHYFWHVATLQKKIRRSSCGGPFCGAPVRPNMLNMPKCAADGTCYVQTTQNTPQTIPVFCNIQ